MTSPHQEPSEHDWHEQDGTGWEQCSNCWAWRKPNVHDYADAVCHPQSKEERACKCYKTGTFVIFTGDCPLHRPTPTKSDEGEDKLNEAIDHALVDLKPTLEKLGRPPSGKSGWEVEFEDSFPTQLWTSPTGNGGYDAKPYVKSFINQTLQSALKEQEREKYELGVKEFGKWLLENGHGGGNWRRLIIHRTGLTQSQPKEGKSL